MNNNDKHVLNIIEKHKNSTIGCLSHLKFVYKIAKKYSEKNPFLEFDDIFQAGLYGLIIAEKFYKKESNIKFLSYAVRAIKQHIFKFISHNNLKFKIGPRSYRDMIDDYCNNKNTGNKVTEYLNHDYYDQNVDNIQDNNSCIEKDVLNNNVKKIIFNVVSNMSEGNKLLFKHGILFDQNRFEKAVINKHKRAKYYKKFKVEFLKILKLKYSINNFNDIKDWFDE